MIKTVTIFLMTSVFVLFYRQGTLVEEGMVVAIHGTFSADGVCELNNQSGYLVVNPDHLLTGTAVSNSIRCMRRLVLDNT